MKKRMSFRSLWAMGSFSLLLVLAGCGGGGAEEGIPIPDTVRTALGNATYPNQFVQEGIVTLTDGVYEEAPEPGAASHVRVALGDLFAFGAIGDHPRAAAVVLSTTTGGSGTFVDLAVVPFEGDTPGRAVVTFLGDRVKVESLKLRDGQVTVDLLAHGSEDPMCCPTERRSEHIAWVGDKLERLTPPVDSY
jgi:hypothetical protein